MRNNLDLNSSSENTGFKDLLKDFFIKIKIIVVPSFKPTYHELVESPKTVNVRYSFIKYY